MYPDKPSAVQFETTITCGGNCPHCPQKHATRDCQIISLDLVQKISDELTGSGVVYRPYIAGEPLADPRMPAIVRGLKQDATATVELHSNGLFLSREVGNELLRAGLDVMRLSIDGHWTATKEKARPGLDHRRVAANAVQFLRAARDKDTHVEVRMIEDYAKDDEEKRLYRLRWTDLGADVVFTSLYSWPWSGQVGIEASCPKIKDEMFILCDGRVVLCCWDIRARQVVGNIYDEGMLEVWNGTEMARCRALLDKGLRNELLLCSRCDAYKPKED